MPRPTLKERVGKATLQQFQNKLSALKEDNQYFSNLKLNPNKNSARPRKLTEDISNLNFSKSDLENTINSNGAPL